MGRHAPLILVILAFWVGRETAADKPDKPEKKEVGRFRKLEADFIEVKLIAVRPLKQGAGPTIVIGNGQIEMNGAKSMVRIKPNEIVIGNMGGKNLVLHESEITVLDMGKKLAKWGPVPEKPR